MNHCDQHNLLRSHQNGFRQKHSCESQLILSIEDIYRQQDKNKQVDMLILDFTKAFDTVPPPHQRQLMKLKHYGIDSKLHRCISSWLTERTQQVVVDGITQHVNKLDQVSLKAQYNWLSGVSTLYQCYWRSFKSFHHPTICRWLPACCIELYQTKTMLTDYKTTWSN